jgi:PAS domain S-box-containing protein
MNWHYAYTSYIWLPFCTVLFLLALSAYGWCRRSEPGALPFSIGSLLAALWVAGIVMEVAAVNVVTKIFWVKVQAIWQLPAVTAVACFVLEYTWPGRWLTRRNLALLSIAPLVFLVLILTNDLHHLVWRSFAFDGSVTALRGLGNWMALAYFYGLGLIEIFVFVWLFMHSPQHRLPVAVMLIGEVGSRAVYLLEATNKIRTDLPIDMISIAIVFLMYAIALFGFRIFDPITLARQTVIAQMREGMLVLDSQGRVASLNPAAERILQVSANRARGRPVRELLPAYLDGHLDDTGRIVIEMSFPEGHRDGVGEGPAVRDYTLAISQMKDWRGLEVGRVLLLRDVTEPKRAREQQRQQQQQLAMLNEREWLARELHDSLGQVFAFVNSQGQTVRRLLARGDVATADEYVARLVEVAREADVDIRESILGLRVSLSGQDLFPALAQYLERYEKNYGIHTILDWPETLGRRAFEPQVEVQLLRILQEALTNARKHADAHSVRVAFTVPNECAQVAIQDDGKGFDPPELSEGVENRVGLRVMRERAVEAGGSLIVKSKAGEGTLIIVTVPLRTPRENGLKSESEA